MQCHLTINDSLTRHDHSSSLMFGTWDWTPTVCLVTFSTQIYRTSVPNIHTYKHNIYIYSCATYSSVISNYSPRLYSLCSSICNNMLYGWISNKLLACLTVTYSPFLHNQWKRKKHLQQKKKKVGKQNIAQSFETKYGQVWAVKCNKQLL